MAHSRTGDFGRSDPDLDRLLPGKPTLNRLGDLVQQYAGGVLDWDVRVVLERSVTRPWVLGASRLGWTSWLGVPKATRNRQDLTISRDQINSQRDA